MEYNLAGIRNRVLVDKLDDDEFDAQVIDNFINDTQRDIFNSYELPFMEKIFSGSVPTGSTIFAMPSDVATVQSQVVTSPDGEQRDIGKGYLPFRKFNELFPTPESNTPSSIGYWTRYGNNILTSCPTDQDYTLTLFYVKKPKLMTEGTHVPEVPEEFYEALVLGAFMRVQKRNEDFDLARETEREYTRAILQLVERYGYRMADGPIKMQNSQIG